MTDDELKRLLEASAAETRRAVETGFANVETRFANVDARFVSMEARIIESAAETQHEIGLAREATKHQVEIVAESVLATQEKVRRARATLDEKIERTAAETQSMIKFSHQELDRRVVALEGSQRTLEETVADLQLRVQRLETGTH